MGQWKFVPNFFVETVAKNEADVPGCAQLLVKILFALVSDSTKQISN